MEKCTFIFEIPFIFFISLMALKFSPVYENERRGAAASVTNVPPEPCK
jgi:hypothetical protein